MSIHEELNRIQRELKAPKGQRNDFGKYNYRSCEDIVEAYKSVAGDTTLIISDDMRLVGDRVYVEAKAVLSINGNSVSSSGFAREPLSRKGMDDSQITGATSSYARKYALNGLFAIDDTKDADATNKHDDLAEYQAVVDKYQDTVDAIKSGIATEDYESAAEAWFELTHAEKAALWRAPTKGGCFTVNERKTMQGKEFQAFRPQGQHNE
jgi:hypothetical protein